MRQGNRVPCSTSIYPNGLVVLPFGFTSRHLSRHLARPEFQSFVAALADALNQLEQHNQPTRAERTQN